MYFVGSSISSSPTFHGESLPFTLPKLSAHTKLIHESTRSRNPAPAAEAIATETQLESEFQSGGSVCHSLSFCYIDYEIEVLNPKSGLLMLFELNWMTCWS
ncbi:unnamed protein product [Lactuca virosa]|uniref:Uncharacterized protein n=1 Tax=Lactuca virosa TaxID=75947 RepID=A0AAU9LDA8_9ASTR|nr:unnamed protein product [Lactuca virosa]